MGGVFIHSRWNLFTSHFVSSIATLVASLPLVLGLMYPSHTRSCCLKVLLGAIQGYLGHVVSPSGASSSLSSLLDVDKCLPSTSSHRLLPLLPRFRGMRPIGSPKLPTNCLGHLVAHRRQLPLTLLQYTSPFQITIVYIPLTHHLHLYDPRLQQYVPSSCQANQNDGFL